MPDVLVCPVCAGNVPGDSPWLVRGSLYCSEACAVTAAKAAS